MRPRLAAPLANGLISEYYLVLPESLPSSYSGIRTVEIPLSPKSLEPERRINGVLIGIPGVAGTYLLAVILNMRNCQGACEYHPILGTANSDVRRGLKNLTTAGMGPHGLLMRTTKVLTPTRRMRMKGSHFATQLMQQRRGLIRGPLRLVTDEKISSLKRAVFRQIDQGSQRRQLRR
jgi:hypothetical protein